MKLISKNIEFFFNEISEIARYLWHKGWSERNGGNISINVTDLISLEIEKLEQFPFVKLSHSYPELDSKSFWITATGSRIRDLRDKIGQNSGIIRVSTNPWGYYILWHKGNSQFKPTSELPSHLRIHQFLIQNSVTEKVILHTHPDELIAMTHLKDYLNEEKINRILWGIIPEVKVFIPEGIGLVPYQLPGSEKLAEDTIKALENHKVVLWEKHGCLAIGETITEAFDSIDTLNKAAKIFFLCKSAGCEPQGLSHEQVEELSNHFVRK